ncbi:SDR family NAD(P)-dependent oxidoreductase [Paenibacillus sp. SYP-B3998]|uniref:SDR family NAD(P)-dependent oxidoreductase n=1 Tax=Paenibacillus sp. SYP-B3998 TaxID=2678564 RepID=A0A6G4A3P8_9BACL|nr:SDR family NAD(P)-dependent oxidoreductase [Paenibacillus sp. SYP-B3998]NEW09012.1 SDR family NAD(P)-dependent oxidoreductase [Paenibacillus sp. SYP-B3998]
MYNKHLNENLLDGSQQQLFPDANFEDKFKNGEYLEKFFIKREYIIRLASPDDIHSLMDIEANCWAIPLQTDRSEIEQRLMDPACFNFVLEYEGKVIGVIYTQRIHQDNIKKIRSNTVNKYRVKTGQCIQFIALNIQPVYQDKGWGNELLEFVLQYYSLHPEINNVYAVTRCRDFYKSNCSTIQDYLKKINRNGELDDPILKFHQLHGAKVLGLMDNYRPNDDENHGYGVLIQYDINNRPWNGKLSTKGSAKKQQHSGNLLLDLLQRKLNTTNINDQKSLKELGLDSLDFADVLIFMHEKLGVDVSIHDLNNKNLYELLQLCEDGENVKSTDTKQQPLKKQIRSLMRQYPEIVPLSIDGEGPCTFWIHPLSGDVGIYNRIASQTDGTFRMIAIKARGFLSSENKPLTSVIDMAKYYCEMITAVEPEGPYHLVGFSFGGTVAYEIAHQLQMQGKEVDTLLLVESPLISGKESELFKTTFRNNLLMNANFLLLTLLNTEQNLSRKLPNGDIDWNFYKITADDVKDFQDEVLVKDIVRFCKQKGLKQADKELEFKLLSMSDVHISNLRALQEYHAAKILRPNNIKAWLFRTESAQAVSRTIWNPDYLENIQREKGSFLPLLQQWNSVLPKLQTIILEGDNHFDILHSDKSIKKFYDYCRNIYTNRSNAAQHPSIAIVGISGRFPDAENVQQFWENLKNGRNSIREVPDDRGWNINDYYDPKLKTPGKTFSKWGGFLTDIDKFDPLFFKISPRESELMDPSERIFIQEAWKAIEDAGYNPGSISGKPWGVFACAKGDYSITVQNEIETYYLPTDSYSATRLSYLLNLVGPAMTIDTACSSTLSVVVEACNSLILGNCEAAIVGGGAVYTTPNILIGSSQSLLLSPDGQCYTFDQRANGTVVAEAIGVVVLKLLDKAIEDNDHIYGVIRGWGMNQDGKTNGITAPSGLAQSRLQTSVYEKFNINPENITMFEAHGTGTQLGDAIEYQALTETFRKFTTNLDYCALGSLKTNIGHAFFGSGIAGLIKILLSIKNCQIPPSLNYENASPQMAVENSPFFVNTALREWETKLNEPRCAAMNSFGATGTNAHLVIEEYVSTHKKDTVVNTQVQNPAIIVLSAKDENRLKEYVDRFLIALENEEYTDKDLADIAYTLQVGRESMEARLAMTVASIKELKEKFKTYLEGKENSEDIYRSQVKPKKGGLAISAVGKEMQEAMELWVEGFVIDWEGLYRNNKPKRISLPTYPFAKERYWIQTNAGVRKKENEEPFSRDHSPEDPHELMMFTEEWEEAPLNDYPVNELKTIVCFLSNPENQKRIKVQIKKRNPGANVIFISQGKDFQKDNEENYLISKSDKRTYEEAFSGILTDYKKITAVVYLWPYEDPECIEDYKNIVYILQAIASEKVETERFILGAQYKTELERCYLESWIGFERSLGPMVSKTRVKVVIQEKENSNQREITEEISERLWKEIEAVSKVQSVLYKEGKRYEYKIKETSANPGETPLKTGGTYLITGGLGKLGLIFARHLAQEYSTNLILSGRSKLDKEKQILIKEIEKLGSRILYIQADLCDRDGMRKGIEAAKEQFGEIHGIIHAAGIVDQQGIFQKEIESFEKVINPKIKGTLILDELLKGSPLDFICYFSSSAAILGDFGACDYAVGNRFQMAYTRYKNKLEDQKEVLSKTVVVNWPLWRDGGMGLAQDDNEMYLKSSGQRYLETEEGVSIFEKILTQPQTQHLVMVGQKSMVYRFLRLNREQTTKTVRVDTGNSDISRVQPKEMQGFAIEQFVERDLKEMISKLHNLPVEKLDVEEHLIEYGFDSINLFEFAGMIADFYGIDITPSSLLGYSTIGKIIEYFMLDHKETIEQFYNEKTEKNTPQASLHPETQKEEKNGLDRDIINNPFEKISEPIAIIGISGRFPQADTVESLWNNLKDRKECITEVPKDRWDWREYYGDSHNEIGKSNSKWGGFLTNIDRFDPLFFKISPKEAHIMDPCQRLFLEEAWHALEDAGYMGELIKGKSCGVYVGIEEGEYGFMVRQEGQFYSNQNAVLSARIAYALDLTGPNLSITASCSSGLVALHQACQALRHDDCEMALVGGINLFVSPMVHVGMSMLDLLSPTGKSYVFDDRADGLVPSEAVAVVLLKPLSKAIRDKDQIYGCIKGSGVNYNGKGHGIMSPNPLRQAELINNTFDKYQIDPLNIQYTIASSVGTKLGDAAEIDGLRKAFSKYSNEQYCSIGSIKPLIGHTFAASGIVSLLTMLMAMKEQTILGLHNYKNSNENIDFSKTPFIASTSDQPWTRQKNQPRLGAISTSANSGTNAFAVIEEYIKPPEERNKHKSIHQSRIFIFSATDNERLQVVVKKLLEYIECNDKILLSDIAYTLQVGREAMACRLAIVATSKDELIQAMNNYLNSVQAKNEIESSVPFFTGNVEDGYLKAQALSSIKYEEALLQEFVKKNNLEIIAMHWTKGGKMTWESLYETEDGRRISLPTYPFKNERYWITTEKDEWVNEKDLLNANTGKSTQQMIEGYIVNFFSGKLDIPKEEIKLNKYIQDYGVDSILIMQFIRDFEKHFQFSISGRDLLQYPTISSLTTYLIEKLETDPIGSHLHDKENKIGKSALNKSEYKDKEVIEAMEKYVRGMIDLDEVEKSVGVGRI